MELWRAKYRWRRAASVSRVAPRSSALLYEVNGISREDQRSGSVEAAVTLQDDAQLTNKLSW